MTTCTRCKLRPKYGKQWRSLYCRECRKAVNYARCVRTRKRHRAAGRCVMCVNKARPGSCMCVKHTAYNTNAWRRIKAERVEAGWCAVCGDYPTTTTKICELCLAIARDRNRAAYKRRKELAA